jgi:hypothetical protein
MTAVLVGLGIGCTITAAVFAVRVRFVARSIDTDRHRDSLSLLAEITGCALYSCMAVVMFLFAAVLR